MISYDPKHCTMFFQYSTHFEEWGVFNFSTFSTPSSFLTLHMHCRSFLFHGFKIYKGYFMRESFIPMNICSGNEIFDNCFFDFALFGKPCEEQRNKNWAKCTVLYNTIIHHVQNILFLFFHNHF